MADARGLHPHLSYLPTDDLYELGSAGLKFPDLGRLKFTSDGAVALYAADGSTAAALTVGPLTATTLGPTSNITLAGNKFLYWNARLGMSAPADGQLLITDAAGTAFGRVMFGGITASFPALQRSGTKLYVRLADNTNWAELRSGTFVTSSYIQGSEISDPAAPAADIGLLYFREGAGAKTELVARFPTGAIQQIAIEP